MLFRPAVWYAVIDDSVVERVSTEAPGSLTHHNHNAKPNRPSSCAARAGCAWRR